MVRQLAGVLAEETIARLIINPRTDRGISPVTLREHFRDDIDQGFAQSQATIGRTLYLQAVGRLQVIVNGRTISRAIKPSISALIYYTKARMGWSEKAVLELTGPDGGPIYTKEEGIDLRKLTINQLTQLDTILQLAAPEPEYTTKPNGGANGAGLT